MDSCKLHDTRQIALYWVLNAFPVTWLACHFGEQQRSTTKYLLLSDIFSLVPDTVVMCI